MDKIRLILYSGRVCPQSLTDTGRFSFIYTAGMCSCSAICLLGKSLNRDVQSVRVDRSDRYGTTPNHEFATARLTSRRFVVRCLRRRFPARFVVTTEPVERFPKTPAVQRSIVLSVFYGRIPRGVGANGAFVPNQRYVIFPSHWNKPYLHNVFVYVLVFTWP